MFVSKIIDMGSDFSELFEDAEISFLRHSVYGVNSAGKVSCL